MKKYIIAIVIAVIMVGIIVGFTNKVDLINLISIKYTFKYFLYILIVILSGMALTYLGIPLFLFLLLIELCSFGIITSYFTLAFAFKGLIFSLVFALIFKTIYWFLLMLISFYSLKLIKNNYLYLFKRFKENKNNSRLYLKKMIIISSFILILNLSIVLLGNKVIIPIANYLLFK